MSQTRQARNALYLLKIPKAAVTSIARSLAVAALMSTALVGVSGCGLRGPLYVPGIPRDASWPYPDPPTRRLQSAITNNANENATGSKLPSSSE